MFEKFSDYMYSLLFTPLKKVRQARNQFYLFFKVVGKLFDDTKADIFRIREESIVASASEVMLPEHGRDRDMTRLKDETVEGYRIRLSMKVIISQRAGTLEAIYLVMDSLQLLRSDVRPYYEIDRSRWAEFLICLTYELDEQVIDINVLRSEIRKIKPASAKDNYLIRLQGSFSFEETFCLNRIVFLFKMYWYKDVLWDGSSQWNGRKNWYSYHINHPVRTIIRAKILSELQHEIGLVQKYHYRIWDGNSQWNGKRNWDAEIIKEVL